MTSTPKYGVVVAQDRTVETRDGVDLATDVYQPARPDSGEPIEAPMPALLVRTPYDKRERDRVENQGRWYARRGYVVAIQDVRGRYGSDGEFALFTNEAEDGADTVEWLANRAYCDGRVGTMRTSYMAWVQNALATQDPEGLSAMFVNQGGANAWEATVRHNGAFELRWLTWMLTFGMEGAERCLNDPDLRRALVNLDTRDLLAEEPVVRGQSPLRYLPNAEQSLFEYLTSEGTSDHWDDPSINFAAHYEEMADVPSVYAGAWYDSYTKATVDNFEALADRTESDHFLIMRPWTHGGQSTWTRTFSGEADFGAAARVQYLETRLTFFDHYLKGKGTWEKPRIQYFQMGTGSGARTAEGRLAHGGEWKQGEGWPPSNTSDETYYVHDDGMLSTHRPQATDSSTSYEFDPKNPIPTIGGNCSSYYYFEPREESIEELPVADRHKLSITGRGGFDQRTRPDTFGADPPYGPLEHRSDVLTFRTPPLSEPVTIAGPITVRLFAETDAPDTDFTAKLIDEYPPSGAFPVGFALNLSDSICRGRYRGYRREPDLLTPGEVHEFVMEPYPTANTFKQGHRIRLDVSSSNYPRYDVNHNTGGPLYGDREYRIATNTVYHDEERPSHVELPIVRKEG